MKTTKPEVPYTAINDIYKHADGKISVFIRVTVAAPSRISAMLNENTAWKYHIIQSSYIGGPESFVSDQCALNDVPVRVKGWKRKTPLNGVPPSQKLLLAAIEEGLDSKINVLISPTQWHAVGFLCGTLGITPGEWYLASAAYNAAIIEKEIDEALDTVPHCA